MKIILALKRWIVAILDVCRRSSPPQVIVRIQVGDVSIEMEGDWLMLKMPIDRKVTATVAFKDRAGNSAPVDGVPAWSVQPDGLLTCESSEDGMSATFTPTGTLGTAQVIVTADAEIGDGITNLTLEGYIELVGGQAVTGVIDFGEPTKLEAPTA